MECVLKMKIRIGISACNDGAKVRWNRRGWPRVDALGREKNLYTWTPVCPEILSGMGTPRPPIKLVSGNGIDFWEGKARVKNRLGRDVSDLVRAGAQAALGALKRADVDAYAFMEGSPTCGVYRTSLKDRRLGRPPGVFGALLLKEDIFLFPALDLESPWRWWDWSRRLHAHVWLRRQEIKSKKDFYDTWHVLKFICQEVDRQEADRLGQTLATAPKRLSADVIAEWKNAALRLIRQPSTLKCINGSLEKHYAHYRKHFNPQSLPVRPPDSAGGKKKFVEELRAMELKAFAEDYRFAGHPVMYCPER